MQYRINSPVVVGQTIDDETIIINLGTGAYYSLTLSGPVAWERLEQGAGALEIADAWRAAFEVTLEDAQAAAARLVDQLLSEELIVLAGAVETPTIATEAQRRMPFQPPSLEKYSDMEDLILLDPVHEVDVRSGWPNANPGARA